MSSLQRTIRRKMIFKGMNKHQKALWRAQHSEKANPKYEKYRLVEKMQNEQA